MNLEQPFRTLSFEEAIHWLDAHGGRWSARASASAVIIQVVLGDRLVQASARRLCAADVRAAVVRAVQKHRERFAVRKSLVPGNAFAESWLSRS